MNAELKKKWVEALRSGGYRQVPGSLYRGARLVDGAWLPHCCVLGVLNDVSHLGHWTGGAYVVETPGQLELEASPAADEASDPPEAYPPDIVAALRDCPPAERAYRHVTAEDALLHDAVRAAAGLDAADPRVAYRGRTMSLSELNDGGVPFAELADIIEAQL